MDDFEYWFEIIQPYSGERQVVNLEGLIKFLENIDCKKLVTFKFKSEDIQAKLGENSFYYDSWNAHGGVWGEKDSFAPIRVNKDGKVYLQTRKKYGRVIYENPETVDGSVREVKVRKHIASCFTSDNTPYFIYFFVHGNVKLTRNNVITLRKTIKNIIEQVVTVIVLTRERKNFGH